MTLKYKIIKTYSEEHQVLVRFFSDSLPESALVSAWDVDGITPLHYRTDYLITLPIPVPTGAKFDEYVLGHCPVQWFELKASIANPAIDTSLSLIEAKAGIVNVLDTALPVLTFSEVKNNFQVQVKAESGMITQQVLTGLASEYELTEKEATAYKAAGYPDATATVPLPNSIQDEISSKAARGITITATVACDSILAAATGWRNAQASLRTNRLIVVSKAEVAVDATALDLIKADWATFLSALKTSLGV